MYVTSVDIQIMLDFYIINELCRYCELNLKTAKHFYTQYV